MHSWYLSLQSLLQHTVSFLWNKSFWITDDQLYSHPKRNPNISGILPVSAWVWNIWHFALIFYSDENTFSAIISFAIQELPLGLQILQTPTQKIYVPWLKGAVVLGTELPEHTQMPPWYNHWPHLQCDRLARSNTLGYILIKVIALICVHDQWNKAAVQSVCNVADLALTQASYLSSSKISSSATWMQH